MQEFRVYFRKKMFILLIKGKKTLYFIMFSLCTMEISKNT